MLADWFRGRRAVLLGVAAIIGAVVGVYVSLALYGKNQSADVAACTDTKAIAAGIAPLATGHVAAFNLADNPESLADLAFKDAEGNDTSLAAFAGRTTLVNLWATWCIPCRVEMPALDQLQADLGSDAFEVVAINIDLGESDKPRAFLDEIGVENLAFYSDPTTDAFSGLKKRGLAFGLPVTLLIDGKGCRIGSVNGPAEWDSDDAKALINAALNAA